MGQPIRLFGESDKQCKVRLRALELMDEQSGVNRLRYESISALFSLLACRIKVVTSL